MRDVNDNMVCNAVDFRFSIWFHNNSRKTVLKTEIQTVVTNRKQIFKEKCIK